ncbi:hypothetical protein HN51_055736 [Arachis hypogaea]
MFACQNNEQKKVLKGLYRMDTSFVRDYMYIIWHFAITLQGCFGWNIQKCWFSIHLCRLGSYTVAKCSTFNYPRYERLKKVMPSLSSIIQPNAFQTLICGGLAGSTAALFTTPFDVIKTRLQT